MVGVAKGVDRDAGKEEFHRPAAAPSRCAHNDPVLYFVQRLRDEAHRFAIGTHRAKRAKATAPRRSTRSRASAAAQARAAGAFRLAKAVSRANLADLKAVEGVSEALAEKI
jgi:excinuclease ABC subunit C